MTMFETQVLTQFYQKMASTFKTKEQTIAKIYYVSRN